MNKIKTIFMGTPDFAVPTLEALILDERFDVFLVVTQPDRPVGRGQKVSPPPIKTTAQKHGIKIIQPEKIAEVKFDETPELIVDVAYAQLIPEEILNLPKYGCINIHGSLLPKYRGASCIQAAILAGDSKTGITIMKMDKGLDTGDIILKKEIPIEKDDTGGSIFDKLSKLGGVIVADAIVNYIDGKLVPQKQADDRGYCKKITKKDGRIDWSDDAKYIEKLVRAMYPWPGAWTSWAGKNIKILQVSLSENSQTKNPPSEVGKTVAIDGELQILCSTGALIINSLQLEGKNIVSGADFIKGHQGFLEKILL